MTMTIELKPSSTDMLSQLLLFVLLLSLRLLVNYYCHSTTTACLSTIGYSIATTAITAAAAAATTTTTTTATATATITTTTTVDGTNPA